ncbi:MAG: TIGR02921 family PEP-CTERM protein [Cyanobacteria bacterium J06639_16]
MKKSLDIFYHGIFWTWNLCFLVLVYLGILPLTLPWLGAAIVSGEIPFPFLLSLLGIIGVPTACTFAGCRWFLKRPTALMRLFYGVEAPLFALLCLRLFVLRELTMASTVLLGAFFVAIAIFTVELFRGYAAQKRELAYFQLINQSLVLMVGLYVGTVLAFYAIPAFCVFLYHFLSFQWLGNLLSSLSYSPLSSMMTLILAFGLFGFSATLFGAMPFVFSHMYVRSWWRIFSAFGKQYRWQQGSLVSAISAIAVVVCFLVVQPQPQVKAFALLDTPPATAQARADLIENSSQIRAGLVNAYLQSYRYLSPRKDSNRLRSWYQTIFNLSQDQAQFFQNRHNALLSPFLYQGSRNDPDKAAQLYAEFFDTPIQKAERSVIQRALESTVNREEVQAGLLNIDQAVIRLEAQTVTVTPQNDWAEIELYERYENTTDRDQEIFYSFALPESAVITGLWLGEDGQHLRYPFVVSPRGAAQTVYNGEVERSNWTAAEDPALLEQVGPRQYRLRVFPIPARRSRTEPGHLDLWMTYQVMQRPEGWALPQLLEKRNIYWNRNTERSINNQALASTDDQADWFEPAIAADTDWFPIAHETVLPEGYRVSVTPLKSESQALENQRLAVVIDSSRSMAAHPQALSQTLDQLKQLPQSNQVDWYVASTEGMATQQLKETAVAEDNLSFYGSLSIAEMVQQFDPLGQGKAYDAILLVTDAGNYELAQENPELPELAAPLWILHLADALPLAYEDTVLDAIQLSRGGIDTDIQSLLQRLALAQGENAAIASAVDGYLWQVEPTDNTQADPAIAESEGGASFDPLAARQAILHQSRQQDMTQLAALDGVHAIAKRSAVVTPYSSMLVLVNERQRELLREAEASSDRFARSLEDGQDTLTEPNNPLNAVSVPEASNLLGLIVVAGVGLLWLGRARPKTIR